MTADTRQARRLLEWYHTGPDAAQLARIAQWLAEAGDAQALLEEGAGPDWLREQAGLVSEVAAGDLSQLDFCSAAELRNLRLLRRALTHLGVPCDNWAVSEEDSAAALLAYAREEFDQTVQRMSPWRGWQIFAMWGEGDIPSLEAIAPGARDVVTGYAIRHLTDTIAGSTSPRAELLLEKLLEILPGLDETALADLRAAGIPADRAGLEHAAEVCRVRTWWERFRSGKGTDAVLLAFACKPLLADKTVRGAEIGTSRKAVRAAARTWTRKKIRRIRAGDWNALLDLTTFTRWSELGHEAFGIVTAQIEAWELIQARELWPRAQAGDGDAAVGVLCHCSDSPGSYEQVTGLPEGHAAEQLQAVISGYAARLRQQVETAAAPAQAMPPFELLRDFIGRVQAINGHARESGRKPLATLPWDPSPAEWREFCDRHLDDL